MCVCVCVFVYDVCMMCVYVCVCLCINLNLSQKQSNRLLVEVPKGITKGTQTTAQSVAASLFKPFGAHQIACANKTIQLKVHKMPTLTQLQQLNRNLQKMYNSPQYRFLQGAHITVQVHIVYTVHHIFTNIFKNISTPL